MKTFKNSFGLNVELRNIGGRVLAVKVFSSLHLSRIDQDYVFDHFLASLVPSWVSVDRLFDGSYILTPISRDRAISPACILRGDRSLPVLVADVELDDGRLHTVNFSLSLLGDERHDYAVLDVRFIRMCGEVSVQLNGDEASEE